MKFTSHDLLILFLSLFVVVGIGLIVRSRIKAATDFFQAGRVLPAWLGALALLGAALGAPEVIGVGAAGACFGMPVAQFFGVGAVPALLLAGFFLAPVYRNSGARTMPEFLGLRFDDRVRMLAGVAWVLMAMIGTAVGMLAMARVLEGIHVFDGVFRAYGAEPEAILRFAILVSAAVVLALVLLGGFAATAYAQAVQFCLLLAGFLPMTILGLRAAGGWSGLKASLPVATHEWAGATGVEMALLALVLGTAFWCSDFRVLQPVLSARNTLESRRILLYAAIVVSLLPFVLVLPGVVATALPTPQTRSATRIENGAIIHEITIARPEAEAGKGLVPAQVDAQTGKFVANRAGHAALNYNLASPNELLQFSSEGMLGVVLAALLACLLSGMSAAVTASCAIFTGDLYQPLRGGALSDRHALLTGRLAAAGFVLLAVGMAFALSHAGSILLALLLAFSAVGVPVGAVVLLGVFWKRATAVGALAALPVGMLVAVLHHGLTLPEGAEKGIAGGWIDPVVLAPDGPAQALGTALLALIATLAVAIGVSLLTTPQADTELAGRVFSLVPEGGQEETGGWNSPKTLAIVAVVLALAVAFFLA